MPGDGLEAGSEVVRRVEGRAGGRIRNALEHWHHAGAPGDQVGRGVGIGEPAADEERVFDVDAGEVGRILVESEPLHHETPKRPGLDADVELRPRLDLRVSRLRRPTELDNRGHAAILPPDTKSDGPRPPRSRM